VMLHVKTIQCLNFTDFKVSQLGSKVISFSFLVFSAIIDT